MELPQVELDRRFHVETYEDDSSIVGRGKGTIQKASISCSVCVDSRNVTDALGGSYLRLHFFRLVQAILFQFSIERGLTDTEHSRGSHLVIVRFSQHSQDRSSLELFEGQQLILLRRPVT